MHSGNLEHASNGQLCKNAEASGGWDPTTVLHLLRQSSSLCQLELSGSELAGAAADICSSGLPAFSSSSQSTACCGMKLWQQHYNRERSCRQLLGPTLSSRWMSESGHGSSMLLCPPNYRGACTLKGIMQTNRAIPSHADACLGSCCFPEIHHELYQR